MGLDYRSNAEGHLMVIQGEQPLVVALNGNPNHNSKVTSRGPLPFLVAFHDRQGHSWGLFYSRPTRAWQRDVVSIIDHIRFSVMGKKWTFHSCWHCPLI